MNLTKAKQKFEKNATSTQAQSNYVDGIDSVKDSPMEAAAAAKDRWEAGVMDAIDNDRFRKGLATVTMSDWKAKAKGKGAANFTRGVKDGVTAYNRHMDKAAPVYESIQSEIKSMPANTAEEREQRALVNMRRMSATRKAA